LQLLTDALITNPLNQPESAIANDTNILLRKYPTAGKGVVSERLGVADSILHFHTSSIGGSVFCKPPLHI
jgi:hypothetical protein